MRKNKPVFVLLFTILSAMPVMAQMMSSESHHIVWGNVLAMYAIDIIIIIVAIFAIYTGQQMLSKELKSVFMYIFIGILLIAFYYLLDLFSMLTNNMALMEFFYLDLFWLLNLIAFILFAVGFYKLNALFKKIAKSR